MRKAVAALNPALAAASATVLLSRIRMKSLIWWSVMWRPGKLRVPHRHEEHASYRPAATASQRAPFRGRAVRRIRDSGRATPSLHRKSGDTLSS